MQGEDVLKGVDLVLHPVGGVEPADEGVGGVVQRQQFAGREMGDARGVVPHDGGTLLDNLRGMVEEGDRRVAEVTGP